MSKAQQVTVHGGQAATATFASWFAQFDYSRVVVDVAANCDKIDVMQVISTVTSHAARVYVNYAVGVVSVEFVDRYTNIPKTKRQLVRSTVELEQLLRKHKVIIERQLRAFEACTNEQLLIAAKGEGFDEMTNRAAAAYFRGIENNARLSPADATAIILQLREMGYKSMNVTDRNWIEPTTDDVDSRIVTEATWLNGVKKPRARKPL